ncbi:hypothetical protein [Catellatospora sp. NPDC049609]|uniref:hypothetical protein n=1 Tax=Catellatospora sp. NPDC049609 TaxID=3155505 RepID=UPI00342BE04B
MTHDTRHRFDLTDETDRHERFDGMPQDRDAADERFDGVAQDRADDRDAVDGDRFDGAADDRDVVDGEVVDATTEPEHRHDQDGVRDDDPEAPDLTAEQADDVDRDRSDDDVEPVDLDGFDGTTRGGHSVANPVDDDGVPVEAEATDDPVHPEAHIGDEPADADGEQTRTPDDLAEVEPADGTAGDIVDEATPAGTDQVPDPTPTDEVVGGPDAVEQPVTGTADVDEVVAAASLWSAGAADGLRERWQAAQLRFVDDPAAVAAEMRDIVAETVEQLQQSVAARRAELDEAFNGAGTDTERLRQAVQRYRDFHEQLLDR